MALDDVTGLMPGSVTVRSYVPASFFDAPAVVVTFKVVEFTKVTAVPVKAPPEIVTVAPLVNPVPVIVKLVGDPCATETGEVAFGVAIVGTTVSTWVALVSPLATAVMVGDPGFVSP